MLGTPLSRTSLARRSRASSKGRIWPTAACVEDLRTKPGYGHPQTGPDTGILKEARILVSHLGRGGLLSHLGLTLPLRPRTATYLPDVMVGDANVFSALVVLRIVGQLA